MFTRKHHGDCCVGTVLIHCAALIAFAAALFCGCDCMSQMKKKLKRGAKDCVDACVDVYEDIKDTIKD